MPRLFQIVIQINVYNIICYKYWKIALVKIYLLIILLFVFLPTIIFKIFVRCYNYGIIETKFKINIRLNKFYFVLFKL